MWIFLGAIAVVALLGADSDLRPSFGGKPLSMVLVIQMFMLLTGALIIILTKTNPASISKNEVFRSGMIAIVAVYGIAWMAETMFGAHMSEIQGVLGEMVKEYPWAYAIVLLLVSKFVNSQAAALAAIVPVALAIGVDPAYIVASAPACYGYYILPTYPSDLAAIQFDQDFHYCTGKVCHTPKELFDLLADDYRTYLEIELTKGKREVTEDDEREADALCKQYLERWKEEQK